MKRSVLAAAAVMAAAAVLLLSRLPAARQVLDTSWSDGSVAGAIHVHSSRSDGRSDADDVAAAAAKAGLRFIIFTDHGDATRPPDSPVYRFGVLCIDAVEISTTGGHYVALNLPRAPYPLAGEPRDVAEDVRRLGGFGIAAHPDSTKAELRWSDWTIPIDGLELINPDSSWRLHLSTPGSAGKFRLLESLFTYPWRPSETIAGLLNDAASLTARWDSLAAHRRIVGLAGSDAHAKITLLDVDPGDNRYSLPVPGYEASFSALSVHVTPTIPLSGDAAADARAILAGIRNGAVYTAVDAWASPPAFELTISNSTGTARAGGLLAPAGPGLLRVRSNAPAGYLTTIWRNGTAIAAKRPESAFDLTLGAEPGVYRAEIRRSDHPGDPPWLISNPIYLRVADDPRAEAATLLAVHSQLSLFNGESTAGWTTESDLTSVGVIEAVNMPVGKELRFRYGLSGGSAVGQFAGATVETHGISGYERAVFTIRAEREMRVSVQVRAESPGAAPERWQRSIVVGEADRDQIVRFDDMQPVGATHTPRAVPAHVRAMMFIVDTTNSKPGASGRIWIKNVRLQR